MTLYTVSKIAKENVIDSKFFFHDLLPINNCPMSSQGILQHTAQIERNISNFVATGVVGNLWKLGLILIKGEVVFNM